VDSYVLGLDEFAMTLTEDSAIVAASGARRSLEGSRRRSVIVNVD
jgi:hypothetical protein